MPSFKVPADASPEVQKAFRDLFRDLGPILGANTDLKGRRMSGAGRPVMGDDYVTLAFLREQLRGQDEKVAEIARQVLTGKSRQPAAGGGGTGSGSFQPPNHPMSMGYYYSDRPSYGSPHFSYDFYDEVKGYTDLYHSWPGYGYAIIDTPQSEWRQNMTRSLARATADGKKIYLMFGLGGEANPWMQDVGDDRAKTDFVLDLAADFWDAVTWCDLADEGFRGPSGFDDAQSTIDMVRGRIDQFGLDQKPLGCTSGGSGLLTGSVVDADFDFINVECYVDPPGSDNSQENVNKLNAFMDAALDRIDAAKSILFVVMAYARNNGWTNIPTLVDLQSPPYLRGFDDPRVDGLTMFSYGRESGTHQHQELAVIHKQISQAMFSNTRAARSTFRKRGVYQEFVDEAVNRYMGAAGIASKTLTVGAEIAFRDGVLARLVSDWGFLAFADGDDLSLIHVTGSSVRRRFREVYRIYIPSTNKVKIGKASFQQSVVDINQVVLT